MDALRHVVLGARLRRQIDEVRSSDNRLFFYEHYGREATSDGELMQYCQSRRSFGISASVG